MEFRLHNVNLPSDLDFARNKLDYFYTKSERIRASIARPLDLYCFSSMDRCAKASGEMLHVIWMRLAFPSLGWPGRLGFGLDGMSVFQFGDLAKGLE